MGIVSWIVVGAIAGWLASIVMKTRQQGLITDIMVGIVGGLVGGFVLNALGVGGDVSGINLESIAVAFVGAVIFLAALHYLFRRK